jgi:hypothetical protein
MRQLARVLLLAFVLVPAASASAAPPVFQTVEVDFTLPPDPAVTAQCGFPVEVHGFGTWKISVHERKGGTTVEIDRLIHSGVTFTNLTTGESYTSRSAGPSIITTYADGTGTTAGVGIFDIEIVQGEGVLWKNVGRIVWDEAGTVIFEAGSHPAFTGGDASGLCAALR